MRLKIENIYFCLLSPVHLFQFWNKVSFENQHLEMTLVNQNAILTGEKTKKKKKESSSQVRFSAVSIYSISWNYAIFYNASTKNKSISNQINSSYLLQVTLDMYVNTTMAFLRMHTFSITFKTCF